MNLTRSARFLCLPVLLLLAACGGEQAALDSALEERTISAYSSFLESYPDSHNAPRVQALLDDAKLRDRFTQQVDEALAEADDPLVALGGLLRRIVDEEFAAGAETPRFVSDDSFLHRLLGLEYVPTGAEPTAAEMEGIAALFMPLYVVRAHLKEESLHAELFFAEDRMARTAALLAARKPQTDFEELTLADLEENIWSGLESSLSDLTAEGGSIGQFVATRNQETARSLLLSKVYREGVNELYTAASDAEMPLEVREFALTRLLKWADLVVPTPEQVQTLELLADGSEAGRLKELAVSVIERHLQRQEG